MIVQGVDALVIAAIDGTTLSNALENAAAAGIPVVAYDRLIRDSGNVDYYATFDNFQVGVLQADSLVKGLKERFPDVKPWNVELFGGSPDDNNAFFFYDGAMSVLQPLIDDGSIKIAPARPAWTWSAPCAGCRRPPRPAWITCSRPTTPTPASHGVLSPYDGLSIGILSSLKGVGYGSADLPMPIVTGQDAEVPSVKSILGDEQYSTVFKDTRELAKVTVGMVNAAARRRHARRSTTPRPTTTASRSCRPTCSFPSRSTRPTGKRRWSAPATTPRTRSSKSGIEGGPGLGPPLPRGGPNAADPRDARHHQDLPGRARARQRQSGGACPARSTRWSARTAPASRR